MQGPPVILHTTKIKIILYVYFDACLELVDCMLHVNVKAVSFYSEGSNHLLSLSLTIFDRILYCYVAKSQALGCLNCVDNQLSMTKDRGGLGVICDNLEQVFG